MNINNFMRIVDIRAFKLAAEHFNCIIGVRRLNPASLPYVGMHGYIPKSIFCKAKTAKKNVLLTSGQVSKVAGLVVDPTLEGMEKAYDNSEKAKESWNEFLKSLGVDSLNVTDLYPTLPVAKRGGFYMVQTNVLKPHYGALVFCPFIPSDVHNFQLSTLYLNNRYFIHGDYDLYALIPADEREMRLVTQGTLLGQANFYTPLLEPIQKFINSRIQTPMVQHGAQENIGHSDDDVDFFWPNGQITQANGLIKLEELYKKELGNRDVG